MKIPLLAFLDYSTLRQCSPQQILELLAAQSYSFLVEEETLHEVRTLHGISWVDEPVSDGRISEHRIYDLREIRLISKIEKKCGTTRSEVASRVAAKSRNAILIAQDPLTQQLLERHVPDVEAVSPLHFSNALSLRTEVLLATDIGAFPRSKSLEAQ